MNRGIPTGLAQALRAVVVTAVLITTACGATGNTTGAVDVKVTAPTPNQDVPVGVSILIKADVSGANITRVDVLVDGAPYAILTTDDKTKGMPTFPVNVPWAPTTTGIHVVQFIVYGADAKVLLQTAPLIFKSSGADGSVTATPVPTPSAATPVAQPTPATSITSTTPVNGSAMLTDTAPTTQAIAVLTTATSAEASLTIVSEVANVRSGPDTSYAVIGQLKRDAVAVVRGKTADGTWWQIAYASAPDGVGWVRADLAQANPAASNVSVVNAPVLPTAAPVTITVAATTVAQATIAPTAAGRGCDASTPEWRGGDARYPFCVAKNLTWFDNQDGAHRYENTRDVPLSLSWDLWGVDSVWMVFEQDDSGYCDFTKKSEKTFSEPVAQTGTYNFNVKDFPGGATLRLFLSIKRNDGQIVQFGDMRLCIY